MIFQAPIDLEIENIKAQAIIDLDTGFIGFSEIKNGETIEYSYAGSPVEFKKAFLNKIEPLFAEKSLGNFKICRKNEKMKIIHKILNEK